MKTFHDLSDLDPWRPFHEGRAIAMVEVALAAGQHTLEFFQQSSLHVDRKSDDSPVTVADRQAEQLTRDLIAHRYPDDTIAGEEFAETFGKSRYRWIVDPIDGTKSFICGVPLYSTLLALQFDDEPIGGAIIIPALGEAVVALAGGGSFHSVDLRNWLPAKVSEQRNLSEAIFVTSEVKTFAARHAAETYASLQSATWLTRTWGDGYGYLMIATGRADLMVDPKCNPWDIAAMVPILNESGGRFSDWSGTESITSGEGLGTNGHLHEQVLALLG